MGSIADISRLANNLARLARIPSQVAARAAPKIQALIEAQFPAGQDSYGKAWAALRDATLAKHPPPPLTDTGDASRSVEVRPTAGAGIAISIGASYMLPHQDGFHHVNGGYQVEARPLLPRGTFPRAWREAIEEATKETLDGTR